MTVAFLGSVGSGSSTSSNNCTITLTANVPQSTPTTSMGLVIFYQVVSAGNSNALTGLSSADNAVPGTGYLGDNQLVFGGGTGTSGAFGIHFSYDVSISMIAIINPLAIGDTITLTSNTGTVDFIGATAFAVSGLIQGFCDSFSTSGSTGSVGSTFSNPTTSFSDPRTVETTPNPTTFAFYLLGEVFTTGVSALAWNDGGITLLDFWYGQGPGTDASLICGYQPVTDDSITWDVGGTTDVAPAVSPGQGVYCGAFFYDATVAQYCIVPALGDPVFNNRMRLSI